MTEDALKAIEARLANAENSRAPMATQASNALQLLRQDIPALIAEVRRLREALGRLASPEAFEHSRAATKEEIERMKYAEKQLKS